MNLQAELRVAEAAALAAGQRAAALQGRCQVHLKADRSPVSDADHAADAIIREHLQAAFPADSIMSEEVVDDPRRLCAERLWVVDPIDGTQGFVDGMDEWSVHIALVIAGRPRLGVVALPAMDCCLSGVPGHGAWCLRGPTGERRVLDLAALPEPETAAVVLSRRQYDRPHADLGPLAALPRIWSHSVGCKVARILFAEAVAYCHPRPLADWDVAAPMALLQAAGGVCTTLDGGELVLNARAGQVPSILFARPSHHASMLQLLRRGEAG